MSLPAIDDPDIETLIDQRASALLRSIDSPQSPVGPRNNGSGSRGQVVVQFFEKRRRKSYFSFGKADEEVCWEQWTLDVSVATPRTDTGMSAISRDTASHMVLWELQNAGFVGAMLT